MSKNILTIGKCLALTAAVAFGVGCNNSNAAEKNDDTTINLLLLAAVAASQSTCAGTSIAAAETLSTGASNAKSAQVANRQNCFYKFTAPATTTYTFTMTIQQSDADLYAGFIGGTPTAAPPGYPTCTNSNWSACSQNSGTSSETVSGAFTAGQFLYIAVNGYGSGASKFTLTAN